MSAICALLLVVFAVAYAVRSSDPFKVEPITNSVPDPRNEDGVINLNISGLLAKKVKGGILTRGIWGTDELGVFTPIPHAEDFHRMRNTDGAPTWYYQAGNDVYVFRGKAVNKAGKELPTPVRIPDVDIATFVPGISNELAFNWIAKDAHRVYVNGKPDPMIDPVTVEVMPGYMHYFKDKNHVYDLNGRTDKGYEITQFDPATIRFLPPVKSQDTSYYQDMPSYIVDKNGAYMAYEDNKKIPGADPASFEVLTTDLKEMKGDIVFYYARDAHTVFYNGIPLVGANAATFHPIGNGAYAHAYGTDGTSVFVQADRLLGADPKTFAILWRTHYEGCGLTEYSKDVAHVFFASTTMPVADPATFETLINGYGRDKRGYYRAADFIGPNLDPKELECNYG